MAIPGPETIKSAIRSRPIPVSLNRPSAPVVVAIETSRSRWSAPRLAGQRIERQALQPLPEVAGGAVAGLGDPAGQVTLFVEPDPGGLDAGAGDGPAFEVEDPPLDWRPFLDQRHHLLVGPVGAQDPLGPADSVSRGRRDQPGVHGQVTFRRSVAVGLGQADREPAVGPLVALGHGGVRV